MRSLLLVLALLAAFPSAAQPVSPDTILAYNWEELLAGAESAAWQIDDALQEDSAAVGMAPQDRAATFRRGIVSASHAAAAAAGALSPMLQMTIALAEPARQAAAEAALGEPATALYYALAAVVDEAADVAASDGPPDEALREAWRRYAAAVRALLALMREASAGA